MDVKGLNKLVRDIQKLHTAKLGLSKELHSGRQELENLLRRREEIPSLKESETNRATNDFVLRIAKLFFSHKPAVLSQPPSQPQSPVKAKVRTRSPAPFLCGVSPPKERPKTTESRHMDSKSELLDLKKEAENLLRNYYIKYSN